MIRPTLTAAAATAVLAVPAAAKKKTPTTPHPRNAKPSLCERAHELRGKVARKHGKRAAGRDICRLGARRHGRVVATTVRMRVRYVQQLRRLLRPPRLPLLVRTAVPPPNPPAGALSSGTAAGGTLEAIARCESGGNPQAVSADGRYTGLYQFDDATWASVGGTGRAGDAPAEEQHRRAAALYSRRGAQPWPVCGS